jgi:hypothetical protein
VTDLEQILAIMDAPGLTLDQRRDAVRAIQDAAGKPLGRG